jgi:hypothetical protein
MGGNEKIEEVHISLIESGDTVIHEGKMQTVCKGNIGRCSFMGRSIFGDSYRSGHKKVKRVRFAVPTSKGIVLR